MEPNVDVEAIYEELKDRAFSTGILSREDWNLLVEEYFTERLEGAELDDREVWLDLQEAIQNRFEDYSLDIDGI